MDLQTLADKTNLSMRKLRYVLDHGILPATRIDPDDSRRGHPRSFSEAGGFNIALAAILLDAGLRRELVSRFFEGMTAVDSRFRLKLSHAGNLLQAASEPQRNPCLAHILEGRYLSVTIGDQESPWIDLESLRKAKLVATPRVAVTIDMGQIRDDVLS
jgi:hypothetical protein